MAIVYTLQNDLGTVAGANTYDTTAALIQYWENLGVDYSATDEADLQVAMIQARAYLDNRWDYFGYPLEDDQTTAWPRSAAYNCSYVLIEGVPQFIKDAQFEYAGRYIANGSLQSDITDTNAITGRITKEKLGPLEVAYAGGISASGSYPSYPSADNLIKNSCTVSSGNTVCRA